MLSPFWGHFQTLKWEGVHYDSNLVEFTYVCHACKGNILDCHNVLKIWICERFEHDWEEKEDPSNYYQRALQNTLYILELIYKSFLIH